LDKAAHEQGAGYLLQETREYWRNWVNRHNWEFGDLPEKVSGLFKRSLLIVRTQCAGNGAILAATDSDILATSRDNYNYIWPRDAALAAVALDRAGFPEIPARFFCLSAQMITEDGYNLQRYNADGTPGSSWYPLLREGREQIPIQEDETALVICALWHHYRRYRNFEEMVPLYWDLIKKSGDFLLQFRDPQTGLPLTSYDLWEERRGVFSFTAAAVCAGLTAAANFGNLFGDARRAQLYRQGAQEIEKGIENYLYDEKAGRFLRGIYYRQRDDKLELIPDFTLDSSLYGLFGFGVFAADDPRVERTMKAVEEGLRVNTWVGGLARYTADWFYRMSDDIENVPGSPWIITTLWLAEWYSAKAKSKKDLSQARLLLEWAAERAMESGVLAEQYHPYTGEPLSVAPLTWSHSTFILAVANYTDKWREL
jgi:GH15 family glucan-1,4-alpha-glucosidase